MMMKFSFVSLNSVVAVFVFVILLQRLFVEHHEKVALAIVVLLPLLLDSSSFLF